MDPEIILQVEGLAIGYGRAIQEEICFCLQEGETMVILGRNGSGKSTLLRTLAGIKKPLKGEILLHSRQIKTYKPVDLARELSIVFTASREPVPGMLVRELLELGRYPHTGVWHHLTEADRDLMESTARSLGILSLLNRNLRELSDGELQKAMIARALVQDTHVLLLDEPTASLDMFSQKEIFQILARLASESGKTIVFATHAADAAIAIADYCLLLGKNNFPVFGKTSALIDSGSYEAFLRSQQMQGSA